MSTDPSCPRGARRSARGRRTIPTSSLTLPLLVCTCLVIACGSEAVVEPEPEPEFDYSETAGVYDLQAVVETFDGAWGDQTGYRYTAVVTLAGGGPPTLAGTFTDWYYIGPASDSTLVAVSGLVVSKDYGTRDVIEVHKGGASTFTLILEVEAVSPGLISGAWFSNTARGGFELKRH